MYSGLDAVIAKSLVSMLSSGPHNVRAPTQISSRSRHVRLHLHIDGCEGSVGYGAADSAGEGESGVELDTAQFLGGLVDDRLDLGLGGRRGRGHCV